MLTYPPSKYKEVVKMRFLGCSYREIAEVANVSKSTVSKWCKHLKLPIEIRKVIAERNSASQKQLVEYARRNSIAIRKENREIAEDAMAAISSLSGRDLMLIGAALYWAEGYKIEKQKYPEIRFCNSDPTMVSLFLRFLREVINISDTHLAMTVRIYSGMKREEIVDFWSKVTVMPKNIFKIEYQVSRASQGKRPYNVLPFGTLRIQVRGRRNAFRVKGWVDGLKSQSGFCGL